MKRELESIAEFAGKFRAAKAAQRSPNFTVIARTEALIHSKSKQPAEVMTFAAKWQTERAGKRNVPLVCVPTIYKDTSADQLHAADFKVVIYANHGIRAAIKAMQTVLTTLRRECKAAVEPDIVSLEEVYSLVGVNEMKEQEAHFLPAGEESVSTIVLAAGAGRDHGRSAPESTLACVTP